MNTKIFFIVALLCFANSVWSYPISPRPLRLLVEESQYIVFAHVNDIREIKQKRKKGEDFETTVAILHILEVWQGKIKDSVISVPYPANFICPAPPHFENGTEAVVFLDKRKDTYYVHALSYGVKTMTKDDAQVYKQRILEMQEILKIEDTDQRFISTTEWLVKCAEHLATRHEGTYELSRESDFMSYYDRTEGKPFQYAITDDQKLRLKKALFASSEISYSDLGLVDLVYGSNGAEVFQFLLGKMKAMETQESPIWYAAAVMNRMNQYKSSPRSKKLEAAFDEKLYAQGTTAKDLKQIVIDFVTEIEKLP